MIMVAKSRNIDLPASCMEPFNYHLMLNFTVVAALVKKNS